MVPASLSISYLIGSPPIGTSTTTLMSSGGFLPMAMASSLIVGLRKSSAVDGCLAILPQCSKTNDGIRSISAGRPVRHSPNGTPFCKARAAMLSAPPCPPRNAATPITSPASRSAKTAGTGPSVRSASGCAPGRTCSSSIMASCGCCTSTSIAWASKSGVRRSPLRAIWRNSRRKACGPS